jgi:hypothetical protein
MKAGNHTVSLLAIVSDSKNEYEANAVKLVTVYLNF